MVLCVPQTEAPIITAVCKWNLKSCSDQHEKAYLTNVLTSKLLVEVECKDCSSDKESGFRLENTVGRVQAVPA
jgi:hypothetical protein